MTIPLPEALLLGLVQGFTELLPISGAGHLALLQMLFGGEADLATTTVFLQLGTLAAAVLVVRKRVTSALGEGLRGVLHPSLLKDTQGGRDAVTVALATVPTAVVGIALKATAEAWSTSPTTVGTCFLGSALAIGSTYWAPKGEKDTPTPWGSVLVGVAQGAAVLPGLSRSALTLTTFLWLGMRGERAFELSLLVSLPAICAAELFDAHDAFRGDSGPALVLGTCLAFVVGLAALRVLRGVLARRITSVFAVYLVPLGLATLAWGYARP